VERHESDPGQAEQWDAKLWLLIDALREHVPDEIREHVSDEARGQPVNDWLRNPEVRAGVRPAVAFYGHTSQFLVNRGVALTNEAQAHFLDCVLDVLPNAFEALERYARSEDELPSQQFPQFSRAARTVNNDIARSPWKLFKSYVDAKGLAEGTIHRWCVVFENLETQRGPPPDQYWAQCSRYCE
jgi:hypothetical protein